LTLPVLAIGGKGVVSVASHVIGNEMKQMIQSFHNGDLSGAAAIHRKMLPVVKALFSQPSPAPLKAALELKGLDSGVLRLPLVKVDEELKMRIGKIIESFQESVKALG